VGDLLSFRTNIILRPRQSMLRAPRAIDLYERGLALEATDPERAIAAYRRALASRPDLADAHCNLGRLLHDRADFAAAEGHYRLALCIDDQVALYWFNLAVAVEDRGRYAEAIVAYDRALDLEPRLEDAHYNLARLYEQLGRRTRDELMKRRAIRHLASYRSLAHAVR
jgi:tetratricopeptide (TPR) repeat protein